MSILLSNILNTLIRMAPREDGDDPVTLPDDAFVPFRAFKDDQQEQLERAFDELEGLRGLPHGGI